MRNPKQILALERFDSYLEPNVLLNNAQELASYLSKQNPPFAVDQIRPTMSYLIETDELWESDDFNFKLQLAISFVHAYRLSSSNLDEQPINQEDEKYIDRLFKLLNDIFSKYGNADFDQDEIVNLIQITYNIGLYRLAVGCGLDGEIFSTLIKIDIPESVDNIAILINNSDRIPNKILSGMCDLITKNKNVETLLTKISEKQSDFIQGIRSNFQDSSLVECIKVYDKISSIFKIPPTDLFDYIQNDINIENKDEQTREKAVELLTKKFSEVPFDPSNHECICILISRNQDKCTRIRANIVKFAFDELLKINEFKKNIKQNTNQNEEDIIRSIIKKIEKDVWEMASNRIQYDLTGDVRRAILKGIHHLDAKDVKLDEKIIASRLRDKISDVRAMALKVLLKLYTAKPDKHEWLIDQVIELYQFSKEIALYAFSILMSNLSLIEVASNLTDRKLLLDILKDTNELRMHLPEINKSEESAAIVSKHTDLKKIKKILKKVPKSFFDQALDYKKRKQLGKKLKEKIDSDSEIILGLYQPSPLNVDDLLECKELDVVHDLSKVFTYQLEDEIPNLLKRCNKTDLTILAAFKNYELDDDDRQKILETLFSQINSKKRNLALIAFAHLYRKSRANDQLLNKIKFGKKDFEEKIIFYGHFVDFRAYTKSLYDDLDNNIDKIDDKTIKYALKIAITEESERSVDILMHFREDYPDTSFKYYLLAAQSKNVYINYITPEVHRQFAYVMQTPKSVEARTNAIEYLSNALNQKLTPIYFLALFALLATDPDSYNKKEAKQQLEKAIEYRRALMKKAVELQSEIPSQIIPETAIPYLVHILAYHKDFDKDLPELSTFSVYLTFFLTPICQTTNKLSYAFDLCEYYSYLDAAEDDYTENCKKLFNIAMAIIKELGKEREWDSSKDSQDNKSEFGFSERFYKYPDDKQKLKETFKTFRIENLKSPSRPTKLLTAGMTSTPRRNKLPDVDDDDSDSESKKGKKASSKAIKSAPSTPKRKSSTSKSSKKNSSVSALSTPSRASAKSKKKAEVLSSDNEDEEPSSKKSTPKRTSTKSTPKRTSTKSTPKRTSTKSTPKRTPTKSKKKVEVLSSDDNENDDEEQSSNKSTLKRTSTKSKKKVEVLSSDNENDDEEQSSKKSTPKRTTTKSKKKVVNNDDDEQSSKKSTPKRKRKTASATSSPAPSPRRGKTNTNTKTEKASKNKKQTKPPEKTKKTRKSK